MDVKLIQLWLFLSSVDLVLSPEKISNTNADHSSESKIRNTLSLIVPGVESLAFKDDSGHPPKRIYWIPRSKPKLDELTKSLNCSLDLKAMFLLHPEKNETYMGCYEDKRIHGFYCPEFNYNGVQPKYGASCNISSTDVICNISYNASESYKFPNCFKIYGGLQENVKTHVHVTEMKTDETVTTDWPMIIYLLFSISSLIVSFTEILYIFLIGFLIRKYYYRKDITYKQYRKDTWQCLVWIARGMDNTGPNIDNQRVMQPMIPQPLHE